MMLISLILAHLLGDFILQPKKWVQDKEIKKIKSKYLYIHSLLHGILSFIFLWDIHLWWVSALILITHFIIDWLKLEFQNIKNKKRFFFLDQFSHLFVIFTIVNIYTPFCYWEDIFTEQNIKIFTSLVFLSFPTSVLIKTIISTWTPNPKENDKIENDSLSNAGQYIGILERFLVFIFIMMNHWEGVGFMIAAKSVFRFSDLAEAKQRKLTEYVLIGTLLSFGIAICTALALQLT